MNLTNDQISWIKRRSIQVSRQATTVIHRLYIQSSVTRTVLFPFSGGIRSEACKLSHATELHSRISKALDFSSLYSSVLSWIVELRWLLANQGLFWLNCKRIPGSTKTDIQCIKISIKPLLANWRIEIERLQWWLPNANCTHVLQVTTLQQHCCIVSDILADPGRNIKMSVQAKFGEKRWRPWALTREVTLLNSRNTWNQCF